MDAEGVKLTVFFEGPFWVGVFERIADGGLAVCKVTFGSEPKDSEVWAFILQHFDALRFGPAMEVHERRTADHPKRRQRDAKKALLASGVGTKSQQALQMQREERKTQKRQTGREQRDAQRQRRFDLKQQKRKDKHKGH